MTENGLNSARDVDYSDESSIEKEKNFLSIVVYVHNDSQCVEPFLCRLSTLLNEYFEQYEIICVDDASTDKSLQLIRDNVTCINGVVTVVKLSYQQGLETAMNAGVDLAIGDFIFEFDSMTLDYPSTLILDVYRRSLEGFDIVSARGTKHKLSSSLFYWLFNRSARIQYQLQTETFRIISRRAINRVHSMSQTIPFRKALYANCGLKMDSMSYEPLYDRKILNSGGNRDFRFSTALDSLVLFTDLAFNISFAFALIMMISALAGGVYALLYFLLGKPIEGYTTTMLLITTCFFGVFAILAVILKYLSILVNLVFNKQKYMIESIEKIPHDIAAS